MKSVLLFVIFVMVGYMLHPMVLPYVEAYLPESVRSVEGEVEKAEVSESLQKGSEAEVEVPQAEGDAAAEEVTGALGSAVLEVEKDTEVEVEINFAGEDSAAEEEDVVSEEVAPAVEEDSGVVGAMKVSLREGALKTIPFEKVTQWEQLADEEGKQVGKVTATVETVLGEKTLRAKAYLSEGKVEKWVWAQTGDPIQ